MKKNSLIRHILYCCLFILVVNSCSSSLTSSIQPDFANYPVGTKWICATISLPRENDYNYVFDHTYLLQQKRFGIWKTVADFNGSNDSVIEARGEFRYDFYVASKTINGLEAGHYRIVAEIKQSSPKENINIYGYFDIVPYDAQDEKRRDAFYIDTDFNIYPTSTHRISGVFHSPTSDIYIPGSIELYMQSKDKWEQIVPSANSIHFSSSLPNLQDQMRIDLDLQRFGDLTAGLYKLVINAKQLNSSDHIQILCYFTVQ